MSSGNIMPLLMSFTSGTKIQEETNPFEYTYNDGKQIVEYDMRTVGTKSLKISTTRIPAMRGNSPRNEQDKKNEIDDSKSV